MCHGDLEGHGEGGCLRREISGIGSKCMGVCMCVCVFICLLLLYILDAEGLMRTGQGLFRTDKSYSSGKKNQQKYQHLQDHSDTIPITLVYVDKLCK